jgi:hypothetical protein
MTFGCKLTSNSARAATCKNEQPEAEFPLVHPLPRQTVLGCSGMSRNRNLKRCSLHDVTGKGHNAKRLVNGVAVVGIGPRAGIDPDSAAGWIGWRPPYFTASAR